MQPTIQIFERTAPFKYLWMKYVQGVNLNVHCARCLLGKYSEQIGGNIEIVTPLKLDEFDAKYYYICGVSAPYKWSSNFHLAFRYKEGSTIDVNKNGIHLVISDAERIDIEAQSVYEHDKGKFRSYHTCRNWRFAYQVAHEF